MRLPDGIEGSNGGPPASLCGLLPDQVLCKVVGELTGLPHQGLVLQVLPRHLLVDVLQTHQEGAMTKAGQQTGGGLMTKAGQQTGVI